MNSDIHNTLKTISHKTDKYKSFSNSSIGGRQWMTSEVDDENKTTKISLTFYSN